MRGMSGRLKLLVGLDGGGRCALREQYCSQLHRVLQLIPGDVPEEGLVYVVNPTGGVLQGDVLEAEIGVESGAHAIVTTPSATKLHRSDDAVAESRTTLRVADRGILEFIPEPLIPFSGSRFVEDLTVDVERGGRLLAWEILAPGRTARGERFQYDLLGLRLRVREGGTPVLRERAELRPSLEKLPSIALGDATHYGVLLAVGGEPDLLEGPIRERLRGHRAGVSRLPGSGIIVKAVAGSTGEIERLFRGIREDVLPTWTRRPASALRPI